METIEELAKEARELIAGDEKVIFIPRQGEWSTQDLWVLVYEKRTLLNVVGSPREVGGGPPRLLPDQKPFGDQAVIDRMRPEP